MKMFLVLLTAACAQGGKIIFKEREERPRNDRRFGGVDIYPPSTVWGPVQVTSSPGIANNSILFPKEQKQKEVLRLDPSIPVDESLLGNRFGATDDVEGSGEEGSGEEGSGEIDAVGNGREMVDDLHEAEEMHEDGFENICGLTTEYIMPRAAKNKDGQFRFIVNHKLVALSESGE